MRRILYGILVVLLNVGLEALQTARRSQRRRNIYKRRVD